MSEAGNRELCERVETALPDEERTVPLLLCCCWAEEEETELPAEERVAVEASEEERLVVRAPERLVVALPERLWADISGAVSQAIARVREAAKVNNLLIASNF